MKVINKYQGGGLVAFTPIAYTSGDSGVVPQTQQQEGKQSLLDEDAYKELIKSGGLVSDVNKFTDEMMSISSEPLAFLNSNTSRSALKVIAKVNELKRNKERWDDALKTSNASGGLGEVAVGTMGEVYTRKPDGKISAISIQDYKKHSEKYKLLNVSELLTARQYDQQLAYDDSIFSVAENSIGMNKITEHIKGLVSALGTESYAQERHYSKEQIAREISQLTGIKQPTAEIQVSLQKLAELANTPGDYYKVTTLNKSEKNHIDKALKYIWETLGQPAQMKLKATAALNGRENPTELIWDIINASTDQDIKSEITPEKEPGDASGSGSKNTSTITPFELAHNGKTGSKPSLWNDPSTGKTMVMQSTSRFRVMKNIEGDPIGMTPLKNIISSPNGALLQTNQIFFGDKKIGLTDLNNIIYDGGDAERVYLPVKSDGTPNYRLLKEFNDIKIDADQLKNKYTPQQIMDFYEERGFKVVLDDKYNIISSEASNVKPFMVMYGYTGQESPSTKNNGEIKLLNSEDKNEVIGGLESVYKANKIEAPFDWTDWGTDIYKGIVAIPYSDDSSIYAASMAKNITSPKTSLVDARIQKEKLNSTPVSTNNTDFLNNE